MTVVVFLLGLVIGLAGGLLLVLWYTVPKLERLFVFRPGRDVYRTPAKLGIPFEQMFVDTPDGCRLSAWHLLPERPVGSIIYFHGNGGNLGMLTEILGLFYRHKLQVLAVDYRGYGWSTGSPTEQGLYTDGLATVRFFRENLARPGLPAVYWGRSLGSCVAAFAARHEPPHGIILETAFPSKRTLLVNFPQFRPFSFFSRYRLDTARYLRDHCFPVLVVHGDRDRTVPFELGQQLFGLLTGPKEFYRVDGADHISVHMIDTDAYMRRVLQFIQAVRPPVVN